MTRSDERVFLGNFRLILTHQFSLFLTLSHSHSLSPAQTGRPPTASALHTYFMRLKEQGWDIQPTISKIIEAGATLPEETKGGELCFCFCQNLTMSVR